MHHARCSLHAATVRFTQTLVTEANAERRQGRPQLEEEILADARLARRSGTGREDGRNRVEHRDRLERDLVVPMDDDVLSQLAQALHQVVGERVVVVDHQHDALAIHVSPPRPAPAAAPTLYSESRGTLPPGLNRRRYPPPPEP